MVLSDGNARRRIALLLAAVALLSPLATGVAAAQSVQTPSASVVVDEGETVDSVETAAATIVVRGTVEGDVSSAAGSIRIAETGRVGGNVESAAGTVIIDGTVAGDVEVGAGAFELTETGRIDGSLHVGAGSITVDGAVGGDVRAAGESVVLGPNAVVDGEFRYDAEEFSRSSGASVAGGVVEDPSLGGDGGSGIGGGGSFLPSWVGTAYGVAVNLALGAVLLLVFPRFSRSVGDRVGSDTFVSGGVGLLALVLTPLALLLVAITIVGIPLALVGFAAYGVAIWVGSVYGQYAVGSWVLDRLGSPNRWLALFLGVVALALIGLLPWVGGLAELLVLLLGLGSLALALNDRYRGRDSGAASDQEAVAAD